MVMSSVYLSFVIPVTLQLVCGIALHLGRMPQPITGEGAPAGHVESMYQKLWGGIDLGAEDYVDLVARHHTPALNETQERRHDGIPYGIFGCFDSGTNLMDLMLKVNFPTAFSPGHTNGTFLWKHSASGAKKFTNQFTNSGYKPREFALIAMIRSPVSQLSSWKKAPYDLSFCMAKESVNSSWESPQRINLPCRTYLRAVIRKGPGFYHGCSLNDDEAVYNDTWAQGFPGCREMVFESVADVYNTYVRQYRQLAEESKFLKVEIVEYERLVRDPEGVMRRIAEVLELPMPKKVITIEDSAKETGSSNGRAVAMQKLRSRYWLKTVPNDVVRMFCEGLSKQEISEFGDSSQNDNYLVDCPN